MSRALRTARALLGHLLLVLRLNFSSRQAIVYGYLVPLLFLVAFGSVFRAEEPALLGQMGQLMTITILGGACFGLPTALVAERERGIWRRYRLLPVPTGLLLADVLVARALLVASAVALQVVAARVLYQTPLPDHPGVAAGGVVLVTGSFLGLGLLISAVANDVPAVQALGQGLFLPMIMIGGVGVPLLALPHWAQTAASFMPGRYAVELLERAYCGVSPAAGGYFGLAALGIMGLGAGVAGAGLFRWDAGIPVGRRKVGWAAAPLAAWVAVGVAAAWTGHVSPVLPPDIGFEALTDAQVAAVDYSHLPGDDEFVSRLARPSARDPVSPDRFLERLEGWAPGQVADPGQSVRNLLCVAAIADVSRDLEEGQIARQVFDLLRARYEAPRLSRVLAWIALYPASGSVLTAAPELGLPRAYREAIIRQRVTLYATKLLGRLNGRLRD
jgi:ABC-2 type transport system permease protein